MQFPRTVGLYGKFDCATCDDALKGERGGCPFVESPRAGTTPILVDFHGDDALDAINVCPRGLQLQEVAAVQDVAQWHKISGLGGPEAYYGPGLGKLPARVSSALSTFAALEARYIAEIKRSRAEMDRGARHG